ncbi:hypothetical protein BCR34DRAFT_607959 [Clohesyomyces aquaticus]|uniref:Uncharacterized protein n=1 Tax=Clohesyomyces aquaticus TaxID=1231657 RepID=A0A1Y1YBI9_9PLEO|nr:hypothetical protein BCR34DRAFT_607959 [Clohesyomyces aquaticus]
MAQTLPVAAGLPSPRSPTLSDAGMILPEVYPLRSLSPNPYTERPPSPSSLLYSHSNRSAPKLASAPQGRRGPSPQVRSPPLSAQSSRSTLRSAMTETAAGPKKHRLHGEDALASSPTIASPPHLMEKPWEGDQPRRLSNSSSLHSEDMENMKWPGFDGSGGFDFDDSGVVLDEDEDEDDDDDERDPFPIASNADEDAEQDRWLEAQDEVDDDLYSSNALSRRAEIILANAKKRLNVMEGNLRGARQSLVVSPTFNAMKMASELSHHLSAARERDRTLYSSRSKQYLASPLSTNAGSPGHSRVLSETSVPIPFSPANFSRVYPNKRASSAMGTSSGPWSPEGFGHGRFPVRESRSYETMRDRRGTNDDQDSSLRSYSRGSRSPPNTLETLPEDGDGPRLHRSASAATDLRVQMNDLKGRISSLKQRAKEDHMRRRSLQSLRTPSPFTSAEVWYAGADAYKTGGSPITADAGVGFTTQSPVRKALFEDEEEPAGSSTPRLMAGESPTLGAIPDAVGEGSQESEFDDEYPTSHYEDAEDLLLENHQADHEDLLEGIEEEDMTENDFVSVDGEAFEPQGESVYEDAVYEMPVAERHEDRVDAFDYEHFFLHSAMGTYSSTSRRSSSSSGASVETTRPSTALQERPKSISSLKRISIHQRNPSVDSVSTMASFATAAEEQSDGEDENEQMDAFSQQVKQYSFPQRNGTSQSMRSDSAINMRGTNGNISPGQPTTSPRSASPGNLANGLHTSKIFSVLLEGSQSSRPRLALNDEEKQLIYSLAAGMQQVCERLQSTAGDQYERKELRRRLDQARRCLSGESIDGEAF